MVELLALCQPLELSYLETAAPAGVLESLERAGLVTIAMAEGQVRLAHPLHAKRGPRRHAETAGAGGAAGPGGTAGSR